MSWLAQEKAIELVVRERNRQDAKFGEQNHSLPLFLAILTEEVGELAEAVVDTEFGGEAASGLFEEAVHTAAVALAIVEMLIRQGVTK